MTKTQLIERVLEKAKAGTSKAQVEKAVADVLEAIKRGLKVDGEVILKGFGTFKTVLRKARTARNPNTGAPIEVPAKYAVKFTHSKTLLG